MPNNETIYLSGELLFSTVNAIQPQFFGEIKQASSEIVYVDMTDVSKTDSAGLALMLEGIKFANNLGRQLSYKAISKSLAKFNGLNEILSLT